MAGEKKLYKRQWRVVKQRRKLGGPYYLQDGMFVRNPLSGNVQWETRAEWDYKTRQAAIDGLRNMPLTWGGDRSQVLKGENNAVDTSN